jgi:signal transduction histidine kinase
MILLIVRKIFPFAIGSITLIFCSAFQKIIIGANLFMLNGYIVPVIYGGVAGLIVGHLKNKWEKEAARIETEKLIAVIEMAGAVCHEFNQPLQSISTYSELLMMDMDTKNPTYEKIKEIKGQVDRMGKITKKLMNITKYETKDYLMGQIIDIDEASK